MHGKTASEDPVVLLGTWLSRLTDLEAEPSGPSVLGTLAKRGVDPTDRERLARDVTVATTARKITAEPARDRDADVLALHRWYVDWAATARALITRKDWLVMLGVRDRRRRSGETLERRVLTPYG